MRKLLFIALGLPALAAVLMRDAEPERFPWGCSADACIELAVRADRAELILINRGGRRGTARLERGDQVLATAVAEPGAEVLLTELPLAQLTGPSAGELSWWFMPVAAGARHATGVLYRFPFEGSHPLGQGNFGTYSHGGDTEFAYAFDFLMPEGTLLRAARGGEVVWVIEHYREAGTTPYYWDKANFVTVLHDDGTLANYAHLRPDGALVAVGDRVERGQRIGYSGHTGYSSQPHLHFHVWRLDSQGRYESLPIRFDDGRGNAVIPLEGNAYGDR